MKELLEIQRDIDVVLGKGAFDVDAELARIKPSVSSPRRARNQQHGIRNTTTEIEELSPEELAIKGQRIQQIWDESLRQYRLRKQMPEEAQATGGFSSIQYHPAHNMQRPVSFFDDDDPEDQDSDQ
jgi:hypothetical protein